MSLGEVTESLRAAAIAAVGGVPIKWANYDFVPPETGKWAAVDFLPGSRVASTLGDDGDDESIGILQISMHYPRNTGDVEVTADSDHFAAIFPAGKAFTHDGQTVAVSNTAHPHPGAYSERWWRVPNDIPWRAYIPR